MADLRLRWLALSREGRQIAVVLAGVVLGVLFVLTGSAPLQLLGVLAIVAGLVVARAGSRFPESWLTDPRAGLPTLRQVARKLTPWWAWPAVVALLLAVLVAYLGDRLFLHGKTTTATLWQGFEGLIGIAMVASLALLTTDSFPNRRVPARITKSRLFRLPEVAQPDTASSEAEPSAAE